MDSGTTPLQSPGFLGTLTTVHFVLIAMLAVLTLIGIGYGMKLARARRQGVRELEDAGHLERGDTPVEEAAPPPPVVAPAAPPATPPAPVERVVAAPVERVPEPVVAPAPAPAAAPTPPAPVPAATAGDSDLTRLKGLGPKVAAMLVEQGVPDIATLARLDPAEADAISAQLGMFAPRMTKDRWVEQARFLAAGDIAGFEATFGKL